MFYCFKLTIHNKYNKRGTDLIISQLTTIAMVENTLLRVHPTYTPIHWTYLCAAARIP